jgi:phosphoribosylaminoimidazole carboxylase
MRKTHENTLPCAYRAAFSCALCPRPHRPTPCSDGERLYAEAWAPFTCELAIMVVRSSSGEIVSYPAVETVHTDHICDTVTAPAPSVPPRVAAAAAAAARAAIASLPGAGIFGVELFALADGSVLLNEVAPRPHNSGHYTIEACATCQYENHLRAVLGWPLGDTSLSVGAAAMVNVLGTGAGDAATAAAHRLMGAALATPGAAVHWYGKDAGPKRKCGHITVVGPTPAAVAASLARIRAAAAAGDAAAAAGASAGGALAATAAAAAAPQPSASSSSSSPLPVQVGIIMGSDSDLPCMVAAAEALEEFGIGCEVSVVSAHRTPERLMSYSRGAAARGIRVIIAGAGGAAHLPGMVASMTPLPVIGVPVPLKYLDGMDALFSIVQMPKGVPVATVAVGNAANAGLLAARIIGVTDARVQAQMEAYQADMRATVEDKAEALEAKGWRAYLADMKAGGK